MLDLEENSRRPGVHRLVFLHPTTFWQGQHPARMGGNGTNLWWQRWTCTTRNESSRIGEEWSSLPPEFWKQYETSTETICVQNQNGWACRKFMKIRFVLKRAHPERSPRHLSFMLYWLPWISCIVSRIPCFKFNETVSSLEEPARLLGRHSMLRPEQTSADGIRHVIWNCGPLWLTFMVPCFGTGAIAKACLLEAQHWKFYGLEADRHCVAIMMASLLEVIASLALKSESNIKERLRVKKGKAFLRARYIGKVYLESKLATFKTSCASSDNLTTHCPVTVTISYGHDLL